MSLPATTLQYLLPQTGSYNKLVLQEVGLPKPKANEVLVKVRAVSFHVNGVEICTTHKTLVRCYDMAGEIIAVGDDVKGWKVNDRVCFHGPPIPDSHTTAFGGPGGSANRVLMQYRTFPAQSLMPIPEHLSYEEASTLPCAAVAAYNALNGPVPVKAGDFVLVLGISGVSIFAIQFSVAAGATVIVTSSSDEKLKCGSELGAKHLINSKETPDWEKEVNKITKGVGVEHVIEAGGGTIPKSIQVVRLGHGQINVIQESSEGDSSVVFPLIRNIATLRSVLVGSVTQYQDMKHLITTHRDLTRPVVDKVFPFDKAVDAYACLESKKHAGKVVIKVA